jgi:hypothetical protein
MDEFYTYKNEIGINFTNVLGNVLSLNPNNASSPYGLTYRRHYGNKSLRMGINIDWDNRTESDFTNGNFISKELDTKMSEFRIGVEYHIVLNNKMLFSYGADILGLINIEKANVSESKGGGFLNFTSQDNLYGVGLGPILRLEYKISDRIFLSSESSLYGFYRKSSEEVIIGGQAAQTVESTSSSLKLVLPQSLFFNIAF